jgi:hypothetical protein
MTPTDILGRWNIVSWEQHYDDGRIARPMGEALEGFIFYAPDGTMACFLAKMARTRFSSGLQWSATDAEKAQAYDSMLCYGGRFVARGDCVEHHVEVSSFPNWTGGVQKRSAATEGGELVISARLEEGTPQARTAVLRWRRA